MLLKCVYVCVHVFMCVSVSYRYMHVSSRLISKHTEEGLKEYTQVCITLYV